MCTRHTFILWREIKLNIAYPQVLILEDKIIAYFDYWLIPPEAQLITLCVAPHFQKKGFGSYLMNEFVKQCERFLLKEIFLEVRVSNEKAIALYEKFKFEKTQKRKAYYSDNKEDAWVMKRMLKV